jgi:hypothetical protein
MVMRYVGNAVGHRNVSVPVDVVNADEEEEDNEMDVDPPLQDARTPPQSENLEDDPVPDGPDAPDSESDSESSDDHESGKEEDEESEDDVELDQEPTDEDLLESAGFDNL